MLDTATRPALAAAAEVELNAQDRCDRCGAQAYVHASLNGSVLLFCGHHGKKALPGLASQGFDVSDQTHRLLEDAKMNTTD